MASQILSNVRVFMQGVDYTGIVNTAALKLSAEMKEATNFNSGGFKEYKPGLLDADLQVSGYADYTGYDSGLYGNVAVADAPIALIPQGGAEQDIAFFLKALQAKHDFDGKIGDMAAFSIQAQASSDPLVRGQVLHNAARTAGGNGTIIQAGAVGAAQKAYAQLQVLSITTGGSPSFTCKVQSAASAGFASPTDRITFATSTAVGAEQPAGIAGAITDQYWRVVYTLTNITSITFAVLFGIK
jgi:hypothetical protein